MPSARPEVRPCPQCGAAMAFDPNRGRLACGSCGHLAEPEASGAQALADALHEHDYATALRQLAEREPTLDTRVIDCPACGAQTRLDGHVVADRCAFCATPLVLDRAHVERLIRPQALAPFALDRAAAQQHFGGWLKRLWFAPNALQRTVREADGVRGVYLPFWTFDARTFTRYQGERGDDRQVEEDGRDGRRTRTVTDWSPVAGAVAVDFDDLLVVASPSIPERLARVLGGWRLDRLEPYRNEVLAGFTVEAYRTGLEAGFAEARQRMAWHIDGAIRRDIGGHRQRIHAQETDLSDIRFKHLLLPVWIGSYRFEGKAYAVVVNAQTGELAGDRPWSRWKVGLALAAVGLVVLLLSSLSGTS